MQQQVASVVPVLYQMLSSAMRDTQEAQTEMRQALSGSAWVFVGDRFVQAEQVAFAAQVNATPFLYSVPADLACFSPLLKAHGVRPAFEAGDFVQVLQAMALETGAVVGAEKAAATGGGKGSSSGSSSDGVKPLTPQQLELAIALVQRISDESMMVADWEIYAPDEGARLARAAELVYDDAPWLSKMQNRADIRYAHPKLSAVTGDKLGIKSVRRLLMETHADAMDFGLPTEAFGQSEALTRRLRHILELYPEGPSILSELIQNADDAGASTLRVLYSSRRYGTTALLGSKMAPWQGPALYLYNDAQFSQQDFQNIARIGQASKLDKVLSTGRFGLGFNATYVRAYARRKRSWWFICDATRTAGADITHIHTHNTNHSTALTCPPSSQRSTWSSSTPTCGTSRGPHASSQGSRYDGVLSFGRVTAPSLVDSP